MILRRFSVTKACSTALCKDYTEFNENKTEGSFGDPRSQTDGQAKERSLQMTFFLIFKNEVHAQSTHSKI
jgi:hypothetical protein